MIKTKLSWIAQQTNGRLEGKDCEVTNISTDTRTLKPGDVYLALVGDNFNGHSFVKNAQRSGAAAVIASEKIESDLPTIYVKDTKLALGELGAAIKRVVNPKTIAITGSSGKTTVKEMTAAILSRRGNVLATQGNFNNDIGVPLTLLRLEPEHDFAVMELGANHLGEIAYTTNLVKPDVATIVNAAASHLEGFGSLLGVARAKSEIFKGLDEKGVAILNVDSQFANFWEGKLRYNNVLTFSPGQQHEADFTAQEITIGLNGCAEFELICPQGEVSIQLNIPGIHNVGNALLAAALALEVGATLDDVRDGLLNMAQVKGRLNVKMLTNQVRLLDDTYNANVASVSAAIDTLASFSGKRILILGDMAELGEKARYYHEQVGQYALEQGIDTLVTLGVLSQCASAVFGPNGYHFSDIESLINSLEDILSFEHRDISILVKGSRSSRMERVVTAIEESPVGKLDRRRERIAC
ncbi:UDP-N-acetylmuramoyl-tripeptide--D-alanyl-D-alanine ligase [Alteromonas sp. ASW11-130]|uniref:UDP-N-acetylmuramoyl-tripeptide--D-alanyl-D- alanine ligase n=1 Tax=Alteromonas sp. ASW11-130 TaxID=3015775 RepID=UPI0022421A6B|nr:UDP-N-acetylmuramoyl-tripeptide--D-alanyl-D-alanine ligase [Alteromonas sp. ASW11-130]MCW8091631.1 UDP-N-acetylmuramoyl-tripeptide--D-alanyl-D-alanine ligase [Alteromonas sp. ASW11-130]